MNDASAQWAALPERAVIFDFNGTLSNDEPLLFRMYVEMFAEHLSYALTEAEYYEELAGRSDPEIIEAVVAAHGGGDVELGAQMLGDVDRRYQALVNEHSPIEEGAVALLELLEAYEVPFGIVTGATRPSVEFVLGHRGIRSKFRVIVTEEDVLNGKPDPEGFLRGAELLGVAPSSVLVFEDSLFGLRGAKAAGMTAVGVVGTKSAEVLATEADQVIETLNAEVLRTPLESVSS
jgi:beta-phosphoglucomutase